MVYIYKDRIIRVEWTVLKGISNVREDFSRALVRLFLIGDRERYLLEVSSQEDGTIKAEIPQGLEEGTYAIELIYAKNWGNLRRGDVKPEPAPVDTRYNDRTIMRTRKDDLFSITEFESEATNVGEGAVVLRVRTSTASYGYDGLSSYEIAVLRGDWNGTEGEWLKHERYVSVLDSRGHSEVDTMSQNAITNELESQDEAIEGIGNKTNELGERVEEAEGKVEKMGDVVDEIKSHAPVSARPAGFKPDIDLTPEITVDRAWRDHEGNVIRDTYITRRGLLNEIIDITNQQVTDLKPGSVDPDDLSEATRQLIGNKSITNLPDEEDITVTDSQTLKLKDKEYAPKDYSGMGRVYLRKHYVDGVNTLTQHMMRKPNTIYIIQYDYCLAGQTIEVPEGCVLDFQGGSLRNGTINGKYTKIEGKKEYIFDRIDVEGTWNVKDISTRFWKDLSSVNSLKRVLNLCNNDIVNNVIIEGEKYDYILCNSENKQSALVINSNTNIILLGNIKLQGNPFSWYNIIEIKGNNIVVSGDGCVIGDRYNHNYVEDEKYYTHEWGYGISIINSHNTKIKGITVKDVTGDCVNIGGNSKNTIIEGCYLTNSRRQGVTVGLCFNTIIRNCVITDVNGTNPQSAIDWEPNNNDYSNNLIVENCELRNCVTGFNCYIINPYLENLILRNNVIHAQKYPVVISKLLGGVIENNKIYLDKGYAAIQISDSEISIINNHISFSTIGIAIYKGSKNDYKEVVNIKDNILEGFVPDGEDDSNYKTMAFYLQSNLNIINNTIKCSGFNSVGETQEYTNLVIRNNDMTLNYSFDFGSNNLIFTDNRITINSCKDKPSVSSRRFLIRNDGDFSRNSINVIGDKIINSAIFLQCCNTVVEKNKISCNNIVNTALVIYGNNNIIKSNILKGYITNDMLIDEGIEDSYLSNYCGLNFGNMSDLPNLSTFKSAFNAQFVTKYNGAFYNYEGNWINQLGFFAKKVIYFNQYQGTGEREYLMINIPKEYDGLIDLKIIGNFSHNSSLDSNTKGVSIMHYYVLCRNTSSVKKCIKSGVNIYRIDQEFSNNWINIGDIHTSKPLEIVDGYWTILAFISSGGVNRAFPAMVSAVTYLNNTSDRSIYLDTISVKSNIFTDIDNINFSDVYYQNVTLDSTEISYTVPVENNYIYVINKQITCVGSNGRWLNIKGPTEKRGSYDGNTMNKEDRGFQYYDTTLNKPIWWNGTNWVDATGATV